MTTTHIIDTCAVFFRYYFSNMPEHMNEQGWDVSALQATVRWLCKTDFFQEQTVLAFDESLGTGFRHVLDENYKANRPLPTEDVIYQLTCLKSITQTMGFCVLASDEFEADDLIASVCHILKNNKCIIYSRDKDLKSLLSERVSMFDFTNQTVWTPEMLMAQTGLLAEQIPLYLALVGDSSDNIQGLKGIGVKTATKLLQDHVDWTGLSSAAKNNKPLEVRGQERIRQTLIEGEKMVEHNLALTTLRHNVPLSLQSEEFMSDNYLLLKALCAQLNLKGLKTSLANLTEFVK